MKITVYECDGCDKKADITARESADPDRAIADMGWLAEGYYWRCPACAWTSKGRLWKTKVAAPLTDEQLIQEWLSIHRKFWIGCLPDELSSYENRFRAVAKHWLQCGDHAPTYGNTGIMYAQRRWDEFLNLFEGQITEANDGKDADD